MASHKKLSLPIVVIVILETFLMSSCKTTRSANLSAATDNCSNATLLEKTLALLAPDSLQPALVQCLRNNFQLDLDEEKRSTKDIQMRDTYDFAETTAASSRLGPLIHTRNNVIDKKVYIGGIEIGKAHRSLIAAARDEVLFQTFVWESDSLIAKEILGGLKDLESNRKKSCPNCGPIVVRMIANYGPTAMTHIAPLTGDRIPVDFGAVAREAVAKLNLDPKVIDVAVLSYVHKAFGTNHVKSIIIDGQVAMVTGANPQHYNDPAVNWHDSAYMVAGAIAAALRVELINNLIRTKQGTEQDGDAKMANALGTPFDKKFESVQIIDQLMKSPYSDSAGIDIVVASRNGIGIPSKSNNNGQNRAFQALFYGAKKSIKIESPNFNDDAAIRGLGSALRRGVKVDMILSKLFNCTDENKTGQGGQNELGIARLVGEIGEESPQGPHHDIRWFALRRNGVPTVVIDNFAAKTPEARPDNNHVKFAAFDDEMVVVGSANMDTQSWNQSRELNLLVFHPQVAKAWLGQVFEPDFALAQPVLPVEIKKEAISCNRPG